MKRSLPHATTPQRRTSPGRSAGARFVLRFLAGWVAALLLVAFVPALEQWAIRATVAGLALLFRSTGVPCVVAGASIGVPGRMGFEIVPDCTPLLPTLLLWSGLLAYPASARARLAGMAGGLAGIWLFNLLRLAALMAAAHVRPALFNFLHVFVWQTLTLVMVFALFLAWLAWQRRAPAPA